MIVLSEICAWHTLEHSGPMLLKLSLFDKQMASFLKRSLKQSYFLFLIV